MIRVTASHSVLLLMGCLLLVSGSLAKTAAIAGGVGGGAVLIGCIVVVVVVLIVCVIKKKGELAGTKMQHLARMTLDFFLHYRSEEGKVGDHCMYNTLAHFQHNDC